jgi:opacity protein-like surface antigen
MKRLAMVLMAFCLAPSVSVSRDPSFGIGVHGGASISAFQDFISDYYGIGYTVGGQFDVIVIPAFAIRLNVDYHSFASDKDKLKPIIANLVGVSASSLTDLSGGNVNVFAVTANAIGKIPTRSAVSPYAMFGVGIHSISLSDLTGSSGGVSGSVSADDLGFKTGTKFGLNFGIGTEIKLRRVVVFFQAGYTLVFTEDETNGAIPIVAGISFGV